MPVLLLRSVFAVLRGFSVVVYSWVSFLVKSDIGGILGVWRYFRFFCCWRSGLVVVWCRGVWFCGKISKRKIGELYERT